MTKDYNGKLITDPTEKVSSLTAYYAPLFSCERNNPQIKSTDSGKPFTISINIIRKWLSAIGRKKSVGPSGIPGEILKEGREAMIVYLAIFLDITMNTNAIPDDEESYSGSHSQRGRSIGSWKLLIGQLNLGGL